MAHAVHVTVVTMAMSAIIHVQIIVLVHATKTMEIVMMVVKMGTMMSNVPQLASIYVPVISASKMAALVCHAKLATMETIVKHNVLITVLQMTVIWMGVVHLDA